MENLSITEKMTDNFVLLTIVGSINSYTYREFETKMYGHIKNYSVVADFSRVTSLSSSGLGILMAAFDDGEETGHKIYIMNPSEIVKMAIDSTGFSDVFTIIHSLNDIN
ncbi:MAG: STAS domain-containing protein [Treponema sp.]